MVIELDPGQLADLPTWQYVVPLAVAWYMAAGQVMKRARANDWKARYFDRPPPTMIWLISPAIVAFVVGVWPVAWAASGGFIPPPWRKSVWV